MNIRKIPFAPPPPPRVFSKISLGTRAKHAWLDRKLSKIARTRSFAFHTFTRRRECWRARAFRTRGVSVRRPRFPRVQHSLSRWLLLALGLLNATQRPTKLPPRSAATVRSSNHVPRTSLPRERDGFQTWNAAHRGTLRSFRKVFFSLRVGEKSWESDLGNFAKYNNWWGGWKKELMKLEERRLMD